MPGSPPNTPNLGIPRYAAADPADFPTAVNAISDQIDAAAAGYAAGLAGARPAAGKAGRIYRATDSGEVFLDTGSAWLPLRGSSGKSIIDTSETRTNAAFGLLSTPDRVQGIVVPTDGLLLVDFFAQWLLPAGGTSPRAAIFIGSNQLKARKPGAGTVDVQESACLPGNGFFVLHSTGVGLASMAPQEQTDNEVTTGQAIGFSNATPGSAEGPNQFGGTCRIFVAAGTYDISVQFKSASNTLTVKNRKLWVRAIAF